MHLSEWRADTGETLCRLEHEIPDYGTARFEHRSGGELKFALAALRYVPNGRVAMLSAEEPRWRHGGGGYDIGEVSLFGGPVPIKLGALRAQRMLLDLEHGLQPTFRYPEDDERANRIEVTLSSVNFHNALRTFRECVEAMGNASPARTEKPAAARGGQEVFFELDSDVLDANARATLERTARAFAAGGPVRRVVLTGFADIRGTDPYNLGLSERRARAVSDYLARAGVPENRIELVAMGETDDRPGFSQNRRVRVELVR